MAAGCRLRGTPNDRREEGNSMSRWIVLLGLVVSLMAGELGSAFAQDATPTTALASAPTILPPDASVAGLTTGEWAGRFTQWLLSFPNAMQPSNDVTGE